MVVEFMLKISTKITSLSQRNRVGFIRKMNAKTSIVTTNNLMLWNGLKLILLNTWYWCVCVCVDVC